MSGFARCWLVLLLRQLQKLLMPEVAVAQRAAAMAAHLKVSKPAGAGRFRPVFMLHGCGGPRPFIDQMAATAVEGGAAAIVIDSYAWRGITRLAALASVCTGLRLHGRERAGDLFAALAWARMQPWIDPSRFAAMGWSHGGWTVLDALALRPHELGRATGLSGLEPEPLAGIAEALVVYPYAGPGSLVGRRVWRINPRVTAIVAGRDYIVGPTREVLERQRRLGSPLTIEVFANVTHAFDDRVAYDPRVRYDTAASAREHGMLRALVARLRAS